jgi:ABC-type phosphate transport system permease subunit
MKITAILALIVSVLALILGWLSLAVTSLEAYPVPLLGALFLTLVVLFISICISHKETKPSIIIFAILALVSAIILRALPEYLHGLNINGVIHRSIISALLLIGIGVPATCYSLFYLLGATPRAYEISRYPLLVFPIILVASAYTIIIFKIIATGAPQVSWSLIITPFKSESWPVEVWQNGWPNFVSKSTLQIGLLNSILGTFLLMVLTSIISLPVGMGIGIFVHQYAGQRLGGVIRFSTTALRAISGIILAITALSLLHIVNGTLHRTFLNYLIQGFGYYPNGTLQIGRSSFLFASIFVSLLVIPIIARATEEGLNSLPKDIREGSLAIGTSEEHTLTHISLPWCLPNIITGLVLGCAEAAGALSIIFLMAGTGQLGVNPLSETTSLAYFIFDSRFGAQMGDTVQTYMGSYQYAAAFLLLIITVGLTVLAMVLKNKIARRYKAI